MFPSWATMHTPLGGFYPDPPQAERTGYLTVAIKGLSISGTIAPMQIHQPVITTKDSIRATWAEVNLTRLSRNLQAIRRAVTPAKVMIVVKANAYGHGLAEVAKHLGSQADYIGVAVLEEGIFLRELGVRVPI